jgi:predicted GNAT family acetyltransferase
MDFYDDKIKTGVNAFYLGGDPQNPDAVITFIPDGDIITVDHTRVDESLRGRGIALRLLNKTVAYARRENKKIIPECPWVKKVMTSDSAYDDVLYGGTSD